MKAPAFPLYAADFYMDTLTWETDDIGTYFCLLMAEWVNGPLDPDTRKLAKIAKKTHQKFIKNWSKISHKFLPNDDGFLMNLRLEEERIKQQKYIENQRLKGIKSAEKRSTTVITTVQPQLQPNHQPEGNLSFSSSLKDKKTLVETPVLDPCPHQEILSLYKKHLPMLTQHTEWNEDRQKLLRGRWRSNPEFQDLEWWAEFFQYIAAKCPFLIGDNNRQWQADLPWILQKKHFIEIREGKYERGGK